MSEKESLQPDTAPFLGYGSTLSSSSTLWNEGPAQPAQEGLINSGKSATVLGTSSIPPLFLTVPRAQNEGHHPGNINTLSQAKSATGRDGKFDQTPSPKQEQSSQPGAVPFPAQVAQPECQSAYAFESPPSQPLPCVQVPPNGDNTTGKHESQAPHIGRNKCITVLGTLLGIICVLLGVLVAMAIFEKIDFLLPNGNEHKTYTHLADLMPNDTILLYDGNLSSITISEVLPATSHKPDVDLFVTECSDLIQHTKNISFNLPFHFTRSGPVFILSKTLHYELGSTLLFTITIIDASEDSTLTLLIFDNETKATEYSHNPNAENGAQAIRHWNIDTKEGDNSTHITFIPSYGSYYIPVLSPVPSPILDIELSYMITQVFYLHEDYTQDTNCSLNIEPCSLHFSTGNESCVLAYTPLSSEDVTLQVVIGEANNDLKLIIILSSIGAFIGVTALAFISVLIALIYNCRKNKKQGYTPIDTEDTFS